MDVNVLSEPPRDELSSATPMVLTKSLGTEKAVPSQIPCSSQILHKLVASSTVISQALPIPAVREVNNPALKMSHMESSVLEAGQVGAGDTHSAGNPEARL